MTTILLLILVTALAVWAVVGAIRLFLRDGYGRPELADRLRRAGGPPDAFA